MASKNFSGVLRDPLGTLANNDKYRFTHVSTTGEVIRGSTSYLTIGDDGVYNIDIEYGNVSIESYSELGKRWIAQGTTTINADTTATTLPALLNALVPASDTLILQLETLLADAEIAATSAVSNAAIATDAATSASTDAASASVNAAIATDAANSATASASSAASDAQDAVDAATSANVNATIATNAAASAENDATSAAASATSAEQSAIDAALSATDNTEVIKSVLVAQGLSGEYGFFADGFTYVNEGDVGISTDNKIWIYVGAGAPDKVVAAGTVPSDSAGYQQVTFNSASNVQSNTGSVQDFIDSFELKVFQSPTPSNTTLIESYTKQPNQVFEVRKSSDDTLATIYSDEAGTVEIVQNGVDNKSSASGKVVFYIKGGDYYINIGVVSKRLKVGGVVTVFNDVASLVSYGRHESGSVVTTGSTRWRITETSGLPLAGGLYAIPQNGVWIEDFGAIPDFDVISMTGTDNAQKIQEALDLNLGTVIIGDGESRFGTSEINIPENCRIKSVSAELWQVADDVDIVRCIDKDNVDINGLILRGRDNMNSASIGINGKNKAVDFRRGINCKIRNCDIKGFANNGIYVYGSTNLEIYGNTVKRIGMRNTALNTPISTANFVGGSYSCIYVFGNDVDSQNYNLSIKNNKVGGCLNTVISIVYAKGVTKTWDNEIDDTDSNGFQSGTSSEKQWIRGNEFTRGTGLYDKGVEGYAISTYNSCDDSVIEDNYIDNWQLGGISTRSSLRVEVLNNRIYRANQQKLSGAIAGWGYGSTCRGNRVLNSYYTPIDVSYDDGEVSGNFVSYHSSVTDQHGGIRVSTVFNAGAKNTVIRGNKSLTKGLLISVSQDGVKVEDNKDFAFYASNINIRSKGNKWTSYRASGGGDYGFRLTGTANALIRSDENDAVNKWQNFGTGQLQHEFSSTARRRVLFGTEAPTTGDWLQGDRVFNENSSTGSVDYWVCSVGGTPGTWVEKGTI